MRKFIIGIITLIFLSCHDNSKNNNLSNGNSAGNNATDNIQKTSISLKLVDSIEKSSTKEYDFYVDMTRYFPSSPVISGDSVYTYNDYNDIKTTKFNGKMGGDICYSYENGRYDKFMIANDANKIYGYNQSAGGALQFTIDNPYGAFDGYAHVLYADTSVMYILDDELRRQVGANNLNPISDIIYRYDLRQKQKTVFFKSTPISPRTELYNLTHFYITKISDDKFLFVTGAPNLYPDKTADLAASVSVFNTDLNDSFQLLYKSNRTVFQIQEPSNSYLFELTPTYKMPANATSIDYSHTDEDVEFFSIDIGSGNIRILKSPHFFLINSESEINDFGGLFFLKPGNGGYFATIDLVNFYAIPYKKNKTILSHILYIPSKHKYYYIEVDNNKKGKVYIYEINNLPGIK